MRRKISICLVLAFAGLFTLTSCSSSNSGDTVYGQITEISESSIIIEVGTLSEETSEAAEEISEDETDASESTDEDGESSEQPGVGMSSLELTGETLEITLTDDTVYSSQGGMGSQPGGDADVPSDGGDAPDSGDSNGEEPPEKPDGEDSSDSGEEPPEKPDGDDSSDSGEEPPEMPDGESSDGENGGGEMPSGDMSQENESITLEDLSLGDTISVTFDDDGNAAEITVLSMTGGSGGGQQSSGVDSYDAVTEYTEDTEIDGAEYTSTGTDENAIHVYNSAVVSLKNITVSRTSSDSTGGDNSSFYGVGASILATDSALLYISNSTIESDADGGAGIFSYGDAVVYASDTTITTQQDTSGGIHVAGGGTLYAWDLTVETNGESSAAIRSDRGGGTMIVNGGTYTSNGTGSPAVYSTADITVNNAALTANSSEAICIEGLNSLRLYDCDLTGNMKDSDQNDCTWNVILYQSMSGDSEVGNSTFEMYGGTLTAKNGGMFYTTNTESTFVLSGVDITYSDDNPFFLMCTGNNNQRGWGTSGSNGADCSFTAIDQDMTGDIIWDSISELDFYMTDGSTLTGAVVNDESYAGDGGDGYCNVYIANGCTWTVTGNSTVTNLYSKGTIVDKNGNTVTIKGTDGTVYVSGSSSYTITVENYENSVDMSNASSQTSWSDYKVEKPSQLD